MKPLIKTAALIYLFSVLVSCNRNPTEPEPQPGRRDYVWTVDSLDPGGESLFLLRIWGQSPNDVWAIGASSWSATSIWHYNGKQWRCDSIPRYVQPDAIYGFSKNEVWLGNHNSTIWKYKGNQWSLVGEYKVDGFDMLSINYFDGMSQSNIYGVGFVELRNANKWKGLIMHYNGYSWAYVNVPETRVSFETVAIEPKIGVLVMSGTVYDQAGYIAKIYCWDGKELKELISGSGYSFVTKLGDEIFATHNSKIFKYVDKNLILWKDNSNTGIYGNIICGRSRNDFFIGSSDGITHYNGTNFETIFRTNLRVERGIIFENDVFFMETDYTTRKNYIIRGQLK
jgi:hypothetical protein